MVNATLLKPFEAMLNRSLAQSTTAVAQCTALDGRTLNICVEGLSIDIALTALTAHLELHPGRAVDADATITGSVGAMLKLLGDDPEAVLRSGSVRLEGDTEIATAFSELLYLARPDLEEELSRWVGNNAAYLMGDLMRSFIDQSHRVRGSVERQFSDFLQKDSRQTPTREEAEAFFRDVDDLSHAVERAEARLTRIRNNDNAQ